MSKKLIRTYQKLDVKEIGKNLLIHGALSSTCNNCKAINLKLETNICPDCKTEIKFIAFQTVSQHMPKLYKLTEQRPSVGLIDYDDFKRAQNEIKAKDFLK